MKGNHYGKEVEIVRVKTVFGGTCLVRLDHLNSDRTQLPRFNNKGVRIADGGTPTTIHRDNIKKGGV